MKFVRTKVRTFGKKPELNIGPKSAIHHRLDARFCARHPGKAGERRRAKNIAKIKP
jgi:hypothetical protein